MVWGYLGYLGNVQIGTALIFYLHCYYYYYYYRASQKKLPF